MKKIQADTAINNYHAVVVPYCTQPQQKHILSKMKAGYDYTIGELSWWTKLDKSTVSARRNAMLKEGIITKGKNRKCMFSEIVCETVKLPDDDQLGELFESIKQALEGL